MTKTEEQVFLDVYNYQMKIGDMVAYNYSGELRRGVLRKIIKFHYPGTPPYYDAWDKYEFDIELLDCETQQPTKTMSRVRNCRSLIKI